MSTNASYMRKITVVSEDLAKSHFLQLDGLKITFGAPSSQKGRVGERQLSALPEQFSTG